MLNLLVKRFRTLRCVSDLEGLSTISRPRSELALSPQDRVDFSGDLLEEDPAELRTAAGHEGAEEWMSQSN